LRIKEVDEKKIYEKTADYSKPLEIRGQREAPGARGCNQKTALLVRARGILPHQKCLIMCSFRDCGGLWGLEEREARTSRTPYIESEERTT